MLAYSGVFARGGRARLDRSRRMAGAAGRDGARRRRGVRLCTAHEGVAGRLGLSAEANFYARLQEPYGYWNAIGLTAAMGAIGCLWLGGTARGTRAAECARLPGDGRDDRHVDARLLARRPGRPGDRRRGLDVSGAAAPARRPRADRGCCGRGSGGRLGLLHGTRSAATAWRSAVRTRAGHQLGALLGAMLVFWTLVGIAIGFFGDRRAPTGATRRAVGIALGALLVLAAAWARVGGLAATRRGLTGTISHDLSSLTNPNAPVPQEHARALDRSRERACALLERGARDLQSAPGPRCRSRGL